MKRVLGLLLALVGGILIFQGLARRDSLVGGAAEIGTELANKVDGKTRVPQHYIYISGGAILVLAGAGLVLYRPSPS
ncbi:MAG: DUF3185 family protein [Opitutaceae bacterium]|nr:DUF3185 family protein [Opitutaceae bacterium]